MGAWLIWFMRPLVADTNDDAFGFRKRLDRFPEAQVFWRARKRDRSPISLLSKAPRQCGDRADRELCRDQHHRSVLQVRKQHLYLTTHRRDVGTIQVVNRRVMAHPNNVGV